MQNILAIDVGTSAVKAALVSPSGELLASSRARCDVIYPRPTWAEQDPNAWWAAICAAARDLWKQPGADAGSVAGVSFASQMFGVLPVDESGKPLMNAMIWLDTRSRKEARQITAGFPKIAGYGVWRLAKWLRIANGAPNLAGRDTVSKFVWLREQLPDVWARTHKVLDVKDYLLFRCTGRMVTTTDLASGGWLFCTKKNRLGWSPELTKMVGISTDRLPTVVQSTDIVGGLLSDAARDLGIEAGTPVLGGAGDVTSCAIGSGAVRDHEVHLSLGTSSWLASHLDDRAVDPFSATGTLCAAEEGKYLLIATQETAGASLEWARENILSGEASYERVNEMVAAAPDGSGGVFFFPWLMGERVPVDDSSVRGGFVNLGLVHDQGHLLRSIYEGVGYNVRWALRVIEKINKRPSDRLRIVGGGAQSDIWCQIMADVLQRPIERIESPQFCGARGAALIGARALGMFRHLEEVAPLVPIEKRFDPRSEVQSLHDERYEQYLQFYRSNHAWYRRLNDG